MLNKLKFALGEKKLLCKILATFLIVFMMPIYVSAEDTQLPPEEQTTQEQSSNLIDNTSNQLQNNPTEETPADVTSETPTEEEPPTEATNITPKTSTGGLYDAAATPEEIRTEALTILQTHQANFELKKTSLKYGSSLTFRPTLHQLGVTFDPNLTLTEIISQFGEGDLINQVNSLVSSNQVPYQDLAADNVTFARYFRYMNNYLPDPVNATLRMIGSVVRNVPGKNGAAFDWESARTALLTKITNHQGLVYYPSILPVTPTIGTAQTLAARAQAEAWVQRTVRLNIEYYQLLRLHRPNKTYISYPETIGSWIVFTPDGDQLRATLYKPRIVNWLGWISLRTKIRQINNLVAYNNGVKVYLRRGYAGQIAYLKAHADQIKTDIYADVNPNITQHTSVIQPRNIIAGGIVPGRYRGRYIEISLRQQKMYVFYGYKLLHIYQVSSGRPSRPTPTGTFHIRYKTRMATCAPSPEYSSCYMPNSMFFTGQGHAIHALPIINGYQEGYWHLGIPVSHGCVRLHPTHAASMYYYTPVGTPVVIHS